MGCGVGEDGTNVGVDVLTSGSEVGVVDVIVGVAVSMGV
jgi:hypothetical protein